MTARSTSPDAAAGDSGPATASFAVLAGDARFCGSAAENPIPRVGRGYQMQ